MSVNAQASEFMAIIVFFPAMLWLGVSAWRRWR